ncbi:hypothetical protein MKX03_017045 [Papaver bracteatum]|nr:hypothetical protein MKX03_017045 [Papaver bracteatum]
MSVQSFSDHSNDCDNLMATEILQILQDCGGSQQGALKNRESSGHQWGQTSHA